MKFQTYIPCDHLKPYIKSIVVNEAPVERSYKVIPDTSVVLGFQYSGKLSYLAEAEESALDPYGITGLRDTYRIFRNSDNIGSVLVFFKEGGAAHFFKVPLQHLFGESVSLENFIPRSDLDLFQEKLQYAKLDKDRVALVEEFLISKLFTQQEDQLVVQAVKLICETNGSIRIKELAKGLAISQSPLEKRFRKVIGASPKKYASIIRVQYAIRLLEQGCDLSQVGFDSGYYDQSHFIHDFKSYTGNTPEGYSGINP